MSSWIAFFSEAIDLLLGGMATEQGKGPPQSGALPRPASSPRSPACLAQSCSRRPGSISKLMQKGDFRELASHAQGPSPQRQRKILLVIQLQLGKTSSHPTSQVLNPSLECPSISTLPPLRAPFPGSLWLLAYQPYWKGHNCLPVVPGKFLGLSLVHPALATCLPTHSPGEGQDGAQ